MSSSPRAREIGASYTSLPQNGGNLRPTPSPLESIRPRRIGRPLQSRCGGSEIAEGAPNKLDVPLPSSLRRVTAPPAAGTSYGESQSPPDVDPPTTAAEEAPPPYSVPSVSQGGADSSPPRSEPGGLPAVVGDGRGPLDGLIDPKWVYQNEADLLRYYMDAQEAHPPKRASTWRGDIKDYCVSLYSWGWSCLPFRCSFSWLAATGPGFLSGFFIPFSLVPTAMTCAVISGLPVAAALNSCWILCIVTSLLGGAPGTVSTVTEALATVLVTTVTEDCEGEKCTYTGRDFIFPAGILCGIVQCICGLLGFGRFVSLVPAASKVGYVNAVAIINFRSQVHAFKYDPVTSTGYEWMLVLGLIVEVCLIMHFWPWAARWRLAEYLPPSAVALGASVITEFLVVRKLCRMRTRTVGDVSSLAGGGNMPKWFFLSPAFVPPSKEMLSFRGLYTLIEVALTLVLLSSMSTVMTLEKVQERSRWTFKCDRQLFAVGVANTVSCVLGCLPGTTGMMMSLLANRMGADGREGPLLAAVCLCIFTSAAYHVLDVIPLGGLSGAIIYTAASAISWETFPPLVAAFLPRSFCSKYHCLRLRLSKTEASVVLLTTILGATFDLGSALLIGLFISLSSFAWGSLRAFSLDSETDPSTDTKYYYVNGSLFFSTVKRLAMEFNAQTAPKRSVVVLHAAAAAADHSVLTALGDIVQQHEAAGKEMVIYGINPRGGLVALHAGTALERDREAISAQMGLLPTAN